jgi:hypothetical protein
MARVYGNKSWRDYTVKTVYVCGMNAGLIFRVNNPALEVQATALHWV